MKRVAALILAGVTAGALLGVSQSPKPADTGQEAPPAPKKEKAEKPRPTFKPKESIPVDQGVDFPVDI